MDSQASTAASIVDHRLHEEDRPNTTAPDPVAKAGDVLLSRGRSCLSEWMAWNARCAYSHAAILLAPDLVLEALPPAAHLRRLSAVRADRHAVLDLYRPLDANGQELNDGDIAAAVRIGLRLVGTPFATGRMAGLAVRTLLSRRWDGIRRTPDARVDVRDLNCCELVYLVLHDACGLELGMRRPDDQARPALDWARLLRDWRATRAQRNSAPHGALSTAASPAAPGASHAVPRSLTTADLAGNARLRYVRSLLD